MTRRTTVRDLATGFRWGQRPAVPATAVAHLETGRPDREFSTAWARTPAARVAREILQTAGLAPLVRAEVTPVVRGRDRLAAISGPCVIVMNHASHLDTAVLLTALPRAWRRRTVVAAAADYFFDAWWRSVGTALVFGTVPIERRGGRPSTAPGELLADGWNVVVFPEGTRSKDGWMGRFRLGAAHLAIEHGVPVLPVAVIGSYAAMPRGRSWPAPGRPQVHVRFGPPLQPAAGEDAAMLSARVTSEVARLLDEDGTDWWSSLRHAAAGATPSPAGPEAAAWRRTWESSRPVAPPEPERARVWT